jgi:hypothetical protein
MLATAVVPPSTVLARDVGALCIATAAARFANSKSTAAYGFGRHVTQRSREAFAPAAVPNAPALEATAREPDGRYLYLELVTLLS